MKCEANKAGFNKNQIKWQSKIKGLFLSIWGKTANNPWDLLPVLVGKKLLGQCFGTAQDRFIWFILYNRKYTRCRSDSYSKQKAILHVHSGNQYWNGLGMAVVCSLLLLHGVPPSNSCALQKPLGFKQPNCALEWTLKQQTSCLLESS